MMYSPPPALMSSQMAAGSSRRMPMPKKNIDASARAAQSVLDHDPRSGLPLIAFPADRQGALSHLGNDILLHFFEDCDRVSSKGKPLRRIALITDQTLFVCEQTGSLTRCVQVSKISQVNVAMDNSNEIALVVPSEYDILLRFDRRSQRDDILTILRAVHKRMVSAELRVWHVKDVRPNQYRMEKPPGFQLQRIPQRSRANLAKALESIDANDRERRTAIQRVQERLDNEQRQEILDKTQETTIVQSKLDEANSRLRTQLDEIDKLRQAYAKIQRRVEEIDSQYTGTSAGQDITITKDMKIRELHEVVDALTASVTKANEERMRIEKLRRAGDFDEKELDHVDSDIPRLRGRSLHHQGLVEVLQRQLMEKQRELADLQSRQVDLQKLNLDMRKKEDQLRELEQTVVGSSNAFKDPTTMYSTAAQAGFEDLIRNNPGSPARSMMGGTGGAASPSGSGVFGSPSTLFDDIARQRLDNPSRSNDEDAVLLSRGSLAPPKQFFTTDIPEFRVPPDERDFKEDPRTGLRFKDLEGPFVDKFPSLQGAIIFFFAVGTKENKRGQSQKRVLIVTDQVVYQCTTGGAINRTFEVKDIREFIRDSDNQVALVVEGLNEYDLLIKFKDGQDIVQELQDVISKTSAYNKRHPPLVIKDVETISAAELRLEKPPTWEYIDRLARPRRGLYRALQQLSKTSASERMRANTKQDELRRDLTNRIREELMPEVRIRREREYVRLRQQLVTSQTLLQEKQVEARNLMRQIQTHKCSISGTTVQNTTSMQLFDSEGMYWVPTDPVVMEADAEILHIQFSNNFIVTSHPNGFLNVWDVTSADLVRCLKINGHTARVTTFYFDAYQVLSGGHDSSIRLWHVMQPTPQFVVHNAHAGAVTGVQFDATRAVSSGTDGVLKVWDFTPTSLKPARVLKAHNSAIVGFKMEKNYLASAEWGWIFLWDVSRGIVIRTLRDENGGVRCIDLFGNRIITGGTSGVLSVWNTTTGEAEQLHGHSDDVHCVALAGTFAVSSSGDGSVRMWDTKSGGDLGVFHDCFPQEVKSFFFRSNRFVVGEGTTIKCWTR
jgi:WD40 repeat protein